MGKMGYSYHFPKWYGSINFLGFTEQDACSMRIENPKIASEIEGEILK